MKIILFLMLALCFVACASSDNSMPNNQKTTANQNSSNVNKTTPNTNAPSNISVNNAVNNSVKNVANSNGKETGLNEKVTLKGGESAKIKGTELIIKAATVGTASIPYKEQTANPVTVPFCRVEVTLKDKTDGRQLYYNQTGRNEFVFEGFKIKLEDITPTGAVDCTFLVTKN